LKEVIIIELLIWYTVTRITPFTTPIPPHIFKIDAATVTEIEFFDNGDEYFVTERAEIEKIINRLNKTWFWFLFPEIDLDLAGGEQPYMIIRSDGYGARYDINLSSVTVNGIYYFCGAMPMLKGYLYRCQ
ncbi:MAG: hypothetical protein IIW34_06560, partial [Clostridia bacterium]|nr:hypothetical protein [Clostridia bacterium]